MTWNISESYGIRWVLFDDSVQGRSLNEALGKSKGLAAIKCVDVDVATLLVQLSESLYIDGHPVRCDFGAEDSRAEEWKCAYCGCSNYHWRTQCYKCLVPRSTSANSGAGPQGQEGAQDCSSAILSTFDASHDACLSPSKFILLQSVRKDINAEKIFSIFSLSSLSQLERVWLATDKQTKASFGFAFVQFQSLDEASEALHKCTNDASFGEIFEGKAKVSFGRDLYALNMLLHGTVSNFAIVHWNPMVELMTFPAIDIAVDPTTLPPKAFSFQAIDPASKPAPPPKKMRMQFKAWAKPKSPEESDLGGGSNQTAPIFRPQEPELQMRIRHFLDPYLMTCFLCDQRFDDKTQLEEHGKSSAAHSARVEAYVELVNSEESMVQGSEVSSPRDRAAERRSIFGIEMPADCSHGGELPNPEEGFGAKLLRKHGWSKGQGLGPVGQGITDPVQALKSSKPGAGLGAASIVPADSRTSFKHHR